MLGFLTQLLLRIVGDRVPTALVAMISSTVGEFEVIYARGGGCRTARSLIRWVLELVIDADIEVIRLIGVLRGHARRIYRSLVWYC